MATSVIYSDDQDDLIMDFERESDTDSEDESSDDDSGEVGEGDRPPEAAGEAQGTGEGTISILDETFEVETGRTDYDQNDHCIQYTFPFIRVKVGNRVLNKSNPCTSNRFILWHNMHTETIIDSVTTPVHNTSFA